MNEILNEMKQNNCQPRLYTQLKYLSTMKAKERYFLSNKNRFITSKPSLKKNLKHALEAEGKLSRWEGRGYKKRIGTKESG